jgi:hypothetical protein
MISIKGERKKHPYDLWHEFLYFLYYQDLIQDDVFEEYREDKYF